MARRADVGAADGAALYGGPVEGDGDHPAPIDAASLRRVEGLAQEGLVARGVSLSPELDDVAVSYRFAASSVARRSSASAPSGSPRVRRIMARFV